MTTALSELMHADTSLRIPSRWERAARRTGAASKRANVLARKAAARVAPNFLTIAGLGSIDAGAFSGNTIVGFVVTGFSLLLLDFNMENEKKVGGEE